MTDEQLKHIVEHLCEHLHLAIRLKGSEAHPPNAKELGFDSASVRTVLLTGLRAAGVTIPAVVQKRKHGRPKCSVVLRASGYRITSGRCGDLIEGS